MIDRNFIFAMAVAMALIISYNVYYEWRFGGYLQRQEKLAQAEKVELEEVEKASPNAQNRPEELRSDKSDELGAGAYPVSPVGDVTAPISPDAQEPVTVSGDTGEAGTAKVKTVRISTGVMNIVLSNRGAAPVKFEMTRYRDSKLNNIDIWFDSADIVRKQAELEMQARV